MQNDADIVVIGAGAAGLMAAIHAARCGTGARVVVLDGARTLGAKILIAGGGRCNVTHDVVDETAFAGSTRNAIRKVLRRYDVAATTAFFAEIGVSLKREETGKLFPTTDDARTVLNALLDEARERGVRIAYPWRVSGIRRDSGGFSVVDTSGDTMNAVRVIIATGGMSIPKSGSDGFGYSLVRSLGHTTTDLFTPGLVPLTLPDGHFLRALSGVTLPATLEVRSGTGKRLVSFTDSTLLTHFGLSGPSVLDISRYYLHAINADAHATLVANWLPGTSAEAFDSELQTLGSSVLGLLRTRLPERLARALCEHAGVNPASRGDQLTREARRTLSSAITQLSLRVTGSRGYNFAEVTSGGVPLSELRLETMESRVCEGLYLCGEICDVDGRIGGYNFQWAWSSGYVAGISAATINR